MDPMVEQLLDNVAAAADQLDTTIDELSDRRDEGGPDKKQILLELPGFRLRRRELDARHVALAAMAATMPPPSAAIVASIKSETDKLADLTAKRAAVGLLVAAANDLMSAVPRAGA